MRRSLNLMVALLGLAAGMLGGACDTVEEPVIGPAWTAPDASRPLSHADCVRLALTSAPTAAAWEARQSKARAALAQAGRLPNPSLDASWEDFGLPGGAAAGPVQETFSLAYAIAEVLARPLKEAAARADLDAEHARLLVEAQALAKGVTLAYDELVIARRRVEIRREFEARAGQIRAGTERLAKAGEGTQIEVERSDADLAKARAETAKAVALARALELELVFSLGFVEPVHLELSEPESPARPAATLDPIALLGEAAASRPEILEVQAHYQAELERARLETRRLKFLPTLSFGPREQGGQWRGVAGFNVELPVFDSGDAAQDAQRAELLAAAAEARAVAQKIAAEVQIAVDRLAAAQDFLESHARDLASRRSALRERTARMLAAGEATFGDLASAHRDESDARIDALDAEADVAKAAVALEAARGAFARTPLAVADSQPTSRP